MRSKSRFLLLFSLLIVTGSLTIVSIGLSSYTFARLEIDTKTKIVSNKVTVNSESMNSGNSMISSSIHNENPPVEFKIKIPKEITVLAQKDHGRVMLQVGNGYEYVFSGVSQKTLSSSVLIPVEFRPRQDSNFNFNAYNGGSIVFGCGIVTTTGTITYYPSCNYTTDWLGTGLRGPLMHVINYFS